MDLYSRLVGLLKVLLPLAALGILSTLFLLSRSVDPTATLPFGEAEVEERLREERITAPYFSGTTPGGDQIVMTAALARPEREGRLAGAQDLSARITLAGGGHITLSAQTGTFEPTSDLARFEGQVRIETETGYLLTTSALESSINQLAAQTDGAVTGTGPLGQLEAGQMVLTSDTETNAAHLVFKNGVKLVYQPKKRE